MESGLLSLKWNNHVTTFFHVLETIRKKELYSDVTIACDGKYFAVHKLVLSTCSDYFFEIFDKTQCKHPIIVLKDINSSDFESLLNYMYVGEVNVLQNDLSSLIKAAECLRVKGLAIPDEPPSKKSNKRSTSGNERDVSHKRSKNSCGDNSASPQKTTTQTNVSKTPTVTQDIEEILLPEIKQEKVDPPDDVSLDNNIVKVEKFESSDGNEVDSSFSCMSQQTPNFMTQIEHNSNMPATSGYNESMNWPESENIDDDRPDDMANFDNTNFHSIQSGSQMVLRLPEFSDFITPYLCGTVVDECDKKVMKKSMISQLVHYLDSNNLLSSSDSYHQSRGYLQLQREILSKYPNIIKDESSRKIKPKGPIGDLMSKLVDRRRRKRYMERKYPNTRNFSEMDLNYGEEQHFDYTMFKET